MPNDIPQICLYITWGHYVTRRSRRSSDIWSCLPVLLMPQYGQLATDSDRMTAKNVYWTFLVVLAALFTVFSLQKTSLCLYWLITGCQKKLYLRFIRTKGAVWRLLSEAPGILLWQVMTNQRPVLLSCDQYWPIRGHHCCHVTSIGQSEASIKNIIFTDLLETLTPFWDSTGLTNSTCPRGWVK